LGDNDAKTERGLSAARVAGQKRKGGERKERHGNVGNTKGRGRRRKSVQTEIGCYVGEFPRGKNGLAKGDTVVGERGRKQESRKRRGVWWGVAPPP